MVTVTFFIAPTTKEMVQYLVAKGAGQPTQPVPTLAVMKFKKPTKEGTVVVINGKNYRVDSCYGTGPEWIGGGTSNELTYVAAVTEI